jgi:hypothetical protein
MTQEEFDARQQNQRQDLVGAGQKLYRGHSLRA